MTYMGIERVRMAVLLNINLQKFGEAQTILLFSCRIFRSTVPTNDFFTSLMTIGA